MNYIDASLASNEALLNRTRSRRVR